MRTVGIIGMGHVGATVAYTLFTHSMVDELILIDKNEAKVNAEYNDLHDTLARNDSYVTWILTKFFTNYSLNSCSIKESTSTKDAILL